MHYQGVRWLLRDSISQGMHLPAPNTHGCSQMKEISCEIKDNESGLTPHGDEVPCTELDKKSKNLGGKVTKAAMSLPSPKIF